MRTRFVIFSIWALLGLLVIGANQTVLAAADFRIHSGLAAQDKLAAAQLKACQRREAAIQTIMSHIVRRSENQIAVFTGIADRVEAFYAKQGKTVVNYADLVAAVTAAKTKAQTDIDALKDAQSNFQCTGDSPKGIAASFQASLKLAIADLKAYRTTVKNLIVGVKSVQGKS